MSLKQHILLQLKDSFRGNKQMWHLSGCICYAVIMLDSVLERGREKKLIDEEQHRSPFLLNENNKIR